jgi:hypothetical protein
MVRAHLPRRRRSSNLGEAIGLQALWMITKASAGDSQRCSPSGSLAAQRSVGR